MKDASTSKLSRHHFLIENASKDKTIEQMFEQMYYNNFTERGARIGKIDGNLEQLSKNDKRFLEILDAGTRKNGNHYELPLSLKEKGIKIPNNRSQDLKRMHQLKRRLEKDSSFFKDYKCFKDDLVANGFSRNTTSPSTDDSTWHLPHHGVYHPCKPGKIRVVFDCSAEFHGTSLNKELLPGPDLTSQLVGVLTRFRTEEVAFMADIEAMFHQVHIPEKERSFLRYLWWEDVNLEKLIDYEMCVHVFGGTSSPGCCNYALRRTALDNVSSYSKEVTNTLLRNFYVDDVLKSVPSVRDALTLIQEVRDLCKKGGFKLIKFISNKNNILFQIPDALREDGAKDKN